MLLEDMSVCLDGTSSSSHGMGRGIYSGGPKRAVGSEKHVVTEHPSQTNCNWTRLSEGSSVGRRNFRQKVTVEMFTQRRKFRQVPELPSLIEMPVTETFWRNIRRLSDVP